MAVVLEGWAVVARRAAVEAALPEGVAGWFELAPHRMVCADAQLCVTSFMASEDAAAFLLELESRGLVGERGGAYRDVALVDRDRAWHHECPWLEMGPYAGVSAVWMKGAEREPLVVPLVWRPNLLVNVSTEEAAARLRFVRREGNVEVYVDTETGETLYRGRTSPTEDVDPDTEKRFRAVVDTIEPLLTYDGHPRKLGWFQRRRLARGIRELEALTGDGRWRVWWFLGMARRAASDAAGSFAAFERAYAINPTHADVAREFGGQCLALGRGERAVEVMERNCSLHPRDAGLRANLALACLIADDAIRAKLEVARALEMDPADTITRALASMIDDVLAGRRPRPTTYP